VSDSATSGASNEMHIDVFWGHCDAASIVFYPRYFEWFDAATQRLLESVGLSHQIIRDRYSVVGTPLVDAGSSFMSPASFGDRLTARSTISQVGRTSFGVDHAFSIDGRPVCRGHEKRVWAAEDLEKPGRLKAVEIPSDVRALLQGES
jgi:4-hydroxybenzoyl-CoA thioesterase